MTVCVTFPHPVLITVTIAAQNKYCYQFYSYVLGGPRSVSQFLPNETTEFSHQKDTALHIDVLCLYYVAKGSERACQVSQDYSQVS